MTFKTVVISGGSSGIGLDLAKAYAAQGANIALLARNQEKLDNAVEACKQHCINDEQQINGYSVDVSKSTEIAHVADIIHTDVGVPDLLILSAGIVQSVRFMDQSDEDFERIIQTNVTGARAVAKTFLPHMIDKKHGHVCFVGSLGGLISTYGYSAYGASKFAITGMAGALRQELREFSIGVSVVCPPEVDTPMTANEDAHILKQTRFIKDIGGTLPVSAVTREAVKGIAKNRFIIVPGKKAKLSYAQTRFMPRVFAWCMQCMVTLGTRFGRGQ